MMDDRIEPVAGEAEEIVSRSEFVRRLRELVEAASGRVCVVPWDCISSIEYDASGGKRALVFEVEWRTAEVSERRRFWRLVRQ